MRLRLVIRRHGLPVTRIIWTIRSRPFEEQPRVQATIAGPPSRQYSSHENSAATSFNTAVDSFECSSYTVSQLLADVNEVIPLETRPASTGESYTEGQWALEDYIVEFLDSECLHFMEVDQLFNDGDEVVIRPLEYEDLAARRLTGRHQIAADGTHLIDGVPFGQRYMKRPAILRPPITIPPRNKRRRLDNGGSADVYLSSASPVAHNHTYGTKQIATPTDDHHSMNETPRREDGENLDRDIKAIEPMRAPVNSGDIPISSSTEVATRKLSSPRARKKESSFSFEANNERAASKSCQVDPASCSEEHSDSSTISSSDEESSSSESDSTTSDTNESLDSSSLSSSSSSDDSSVSDTDSDTSSEIDSADIAKNEPRIIINPPGKGSNTTKHNNLRVKLRRRLSKLKSAGVLPENANFDDLRAWDSRHNETDVQGDKERETNIPPESREITEFERKRAQLLKDLQSGGVEVRHSPERTRKSKQPKAVASDVPSKSPRDVVSSANTQNTVQPSSDLSPAPSRSKKLDLASTRRLLFGSLGVKAPKTKDEEAEARNKLSKKLLQPKNIDKAPRPVDENVFKTETILPPPNWQDTIILKATECIYDDISLMTPPFPFIQRWDGDAQEVVKSYRWQQQPRGKKRKRNRKESVHENYNEYWADSNTDVILDYDGAGEYNDMSQSASQSRLQINENNRALDTDFGPTPELDQVSSLDDLFLSAEEILSLGEATRNELKPGAIIAFKQLDLSKATNWEPCISPYRTAQVEEMIGNSLMRVRLAKRDRAHLTIHDEDTDGPRKYSKFEMPGYDEGLVQDDGVREMDPEQLIEPKLVRPAPTEALGEVVAVTQDSHVPAPSLGPAATLGHKPPSQTKPNSAISPPAPDSISQLIEDTKFGLTTDSDLYIPPSDQSDGHQIGSAQNEQFNLTGDSDYSPIISSPVFEGFRSSPSAEQSSVSNHSLSSLQLNSTVPQSDTPQFFSQIHSSAMDQPIDSKDDISIPTSPSRIDGYSAPSRVQKPPNEFQPTNLDSPECDSQSLNSSFISPVGDVLGRELDTQQLASDNGSVVTNPFYDLDRTNLDLHSHPPTDDVCLPSRKSPVIGTPGKENSPTQRVMSPGDDMIGADSSQMASGLDKDENQDIGSQVPQGSCVVDLTMTSDPVPSDNSDEDFLPPRIPIEDTAGTLNRKTKKRSLKKSQSGNNGDNPKYRGQNRPRSKRSQIHRSLI